MSEGGVSTVPASVLYARSQGMECEGSFRCYWCGAPCRQTWRHEDRPAQLGVRRLGVAVPGSPFICCGCWLFRRSRITIPFLGGGYKDGQAPARWGWWITGEGAWAVGPDDAGALYDRLLKPPLCFALLLLRGPGLVALHAGVGNLTPEVMLDTPLEFTVANAAYRYSIYELSEALRYGANGKEPGVRVLIELLGQYQLPRDMRDGRKRGRPPLASEQTDGRILKRVVASAMSGAVLPALSGVEAAAG